MQWCCSVELTHWLETASDVSTSLLKVALQYTACVNYERQRHNKHVNYTQD